MSATEELRRMLDERGVEWKDGDASHTTEWTTDDGRHCSAMYWKPTLSVLISGCTPEQAITATLGGGECEFKPFKGPISDTDEEGERQGVCSVCSAHMHEQFKFCPNCGAKVVDE